MSFLYRKIKKVEINGHKIYLAENIKNFYNDELNHKEVLAYYPNGKLWFNKRIRKNQIPEKVFEREIKFVKDYFKSL